ncbi:hypothetical protein G6K97_00905 [Agrobacterium rhizogenes]|uniref:hypothetical protein n=1 Tax=Rhizobium rhizogenes TaxID=359 RepID=UPI00055FE88F|nr:hypothetical protein [Rhizobium rhizogenes]NTH75676.1 hypothetical protein [Rhizobium rhizogenes]NTH81682.1 hypothetical protein [Rhizobium rhizogenes]
MLTNDFFRDLYNDRWGDPANPNAVELSSPKDNDRGSQGALGRLARFFQRRRKRPSAWSFTISSETPDVAGDASSGRRSQCDIMQPKFLNLAKALSRNC